jgi:Lon protease-like protein
VELGLFPLDLVLLPTEQVPLHVFEPRYKELIGECIDEDIEFGIVLADSDGVRVVGTRAAVTDVLETYPDGRLDVVVEGGARFRVERLTEGRSFHTAEVEDVHDEAAAADATEVEAALAGFRRVAEEAEADVDEPEPSPLLSFALAARVELDADRKQELLELRSEPERLRLVAELFDRAAASLAEARQMRDTASRNGKGR